MKYLLIFLVATHTACACAVTLELPDYRQVHKSFDATSCFDSMTQQDMDECTQKSLAAKTKRMKKVLSQLEKAYQADEPGMLKALDKSQQAWQANADAGCDLETYDSRDGSGYASILNACLEKKINERISYLQWFLDNP